MPNRRDCQVIIIISQVEYRQEDKIISSKLTRNLLPSLHILRDRSRRGRHHSLRLQRLCRHRCVLLAVQLEYQSLNVEKQNVTLSILWIRAQSLDQQRAASILHQEIPALVLVRIQLLQLVNPPLGRMANRRQVPVAKSAEEMDRRIGQAHFRCRSTARLRHILIARRHHLFGQHAVQHSVQVARLHLPHVNGAIRAADNQKVIQWPPLDADHGKQVATGQGHALFLRQAQQRHRVVRGDRANAFLNSGLQKGGKKEIKTKANDSDIESTYAAVIGRHQQLRNLPSVDTESVQQRATVEIPQTDGKVDSSGHQVGFVVSGMGQAGAKQGIHSSPVTV